MKIKELYSHLKQAAPELRAPDALLVLKFYRAETTIGASTFVDWYFGHDEEHARSQWRSDCKRHGLPATAQVTFTLYNPQTLKPL